VKFHIPYFAEFRVILWQFGQKDGREHSGGIP
jgi:hypothetical protein